MSDGFWRSSTEGSDSNSGCMPAAKRPRQENPAVSVKFKGVVLQQNGHWGAQIYANHQRIWPGTFRSEREAAMAYDSAAIKLRSGDSHWNFPHTRLSLAEHIFQALYTTDAVLDMIKDGSYDTKLTAFIRSKSTGDGDGSCAEPESVGGVRGGGSVVYQQLFQKELTPSDVGKLNRLVIPKKHAVKYFPSVIAAGGGGGDGHEDEGEEDEVQLLFLDSNLKTWKFRYCYWKSSQSFVFTRGWNRFVKEKGLRSKDVVCFYKCGLKEDFSDGQAFCMIDVRHHSHVGANHSGIEILGRKILQKEEDDTEEEEEAGVGELEEGDQKVVGPVTQPVERKGVKLFGVLIT